MPEMHTFEEWKQIKKERRDIKNYLEKARQRTFAEEQSKESVITRPMDSIVDADSV